MRGGLERLVCPACGWVHWGNPTPVVAAIVEHPTLLDGSPAVVLTQSHGWPAKVWGLVTGFLERDERPVEGACREVEEELGLTPVTATWVGNYAFARQNQVILAYHVVCSGTVTLGEELAAYKALPPEKVRPWPQGTGPALADWLAARGTRDA